MRHASSFMLFLAFAVARGHGNEFSENSVLDSENGKQLDSIDLRGIGKFISKLFGPAGSSPNGGGPSGPAGSSPNGGGPAEPPFVNATDFESQLDMLSKITEKIGGAGMGPMSGIPTGIANGIPAPMLPPAPWMSFLMADLKPCPTYKIPGFLSRMDTPTDLNDTIDFPALRPFIQQAIREALDSGIPPTELLRTVAPKLFQLKSRCPVYAMQRLISAAFTRGTDEGMKYIVAELSKSSGGEDVYPLTNAIKEEVMAEINRTIFGKEFEEFEQVLKFVQTAVNLGVKAKKVGEMAPPDNTTRDPAAIVFPILQYVLQCETRPAFLQEFISRIAVLKRRVLLVGPWPFTVRVLKRIPFPCGGPDSPGPEMLQKIMDGTRVALRLIKRGLGKMMFMLEKAIIFGDDQGIREELGKFLGNETGLLEAILLRIQGAELPPTGIPPPPLIPDFPEDTIPQNETVLPPYNGSNPSPQNTSPPTPPPQNGTNQSPPTTTQQPQQNGTTPTPPQRRSQTANHNYKAKLLAILKRLVGAKKKRDLSQ